ncbi:hypothetical protein BX600DRAFT_512710 [Xylariales sp. PMI_506]|nr:hypothetical protein BX600DRAFT_512710 [Xylariales sp. PMI_506]
MAPGVKEVKLSGHMTLSVREDALEALKAMGTPAGARGPVMLSVNSQTESIELVPAVDPLPLSISELAEFISATEPRFTFWRFEHERGSSGQRSLLLFFFTCPAPEGVQAVKSRMLYPLMKRAVITAAQTECGLVIDKTFQVEETAEITEDMVLEDLYPDSSESAGN